MVDGLNPLTRFSEMLEQREWSVGEKYAGIGRTLVPSRIAVHLSSRVQQASGCGDQKSLVMKFDSEKFLSSQ